MMPRNCAVVKQIRVCDQTSSNVCNRQIICAMLEVIACTLNEGIRRDKARPTEGQSGEDQTTGQIHEKGHASGMQVCTPRMECSCATTRKS